MGILDLLDQMKPDAKGNTPDVKEAAKEEIARILDGRGTDSKPLEVEAKPKKKEAYVKKGEEQEREFTCVHKTTAKAQLFAINDTQGFWLPSRHAHVYDGSVVRFPDWVEVTIVKLRKRMP